MIQRTLLIALLFGCSSASGAPAPGKAAPGPAPETITFPSEDGLPITADLYVAHGGTAPFVVLFHQAGWSRGEYRSIAPRLNQLGYDAMAVDLRSGGETEGVVNETHARAVKKGIGTSYLDAEQDLRAALRYAREHYPRRTIIAWGSSYSAGLVLHVAGEHPELADVVLAFSPGEYYAKLGKPKDWVATAATHIRAPVFITSARREKSSWWSIYQAIPGKDKQSFSPTTKGNHGSRALWPRFSDSKAYWKAVEAFLAARAPARP